MFVCDCVGVSDVVWCNCMFVCVFVFGEDWMVVDVCVCE